MDQLNQPHIQQEPLHLPYFNMGTQQQHQHFSPNNNTHLSQSEQYNYMNQSQYPPQDNIHQSQQTLHHSTHQIQQPTFNDMGSNQQQQPIEQAPSDINQSQQTLHHQADAPQIQQQLSLQHQSMQLPLPAISMNQLFAPYQCDSNTKPPVTRSPSKSPGKIRTKTSSPRKPQLPKEERLKTPDKRFGGLTEEDVKKLLLPNHLAENLDIIFIGINPGLMSAYKGHHYCNPNNHFWPLLFDSGLIPEKLNHESDFRCLEFGIGMTNIVARTTRNAAELSRKEIADGKEACIEMIRRLKPLVLCFNGKGIYEIFSGGKCGTGRQADIFDTAVYVMPSTSGLVAQYPSKKDKLIFFTELKKLRDEMKLKKQRNIPPPMVPS